VARPIRTFLDSGVLIAAFKGASQLREMALQILEDPDRVFLTSPFVRLEMLPKAIFNKQVNETRFYEQFFARAEFVTDLTAIFNLGEKEAARSGVGSMDSLHIAAAHLLKADAFITTERPTKSIHRSSLVKVVCLFS
jgi:predicted nucleic acid-binding protein